MASGNSVADPCTPSNDTKLECLEEYKGCSVTLPIQLIAGEKMVGGLILPQRKVCWGSIPSMLPCASTSKMGCVEGTPHANY